ncbi:tRNA (adenosine(37)-N6)-threonylcarbamoyltransferase complex dimerization subunit type 1 TsaB [Patescibacteria group bacterium]|nr:tRNA (adenosine(37)-N6)-threonylcarbamoyltransferase complex dimerization subunit type 1 TsaB [Patescibacteria group bacterium]
MILLINSSQTDLIQLKLISENKIVDQSENREKFRQSELLLGMIDKLLQKNKVSLKSLKCLAVVSGPGAFSALRLGVATANAMAWTLSVPVIELSVSQANSHSLFKIINQKSKKIKVFKSIIPKYGKEPNITVAKKSNN